MITIDSLMFVAYVIVTIIAIVTVLMDNRQPAKTVAWVMVLMFLPIVGIVLYFFFGQNIRKEKYISRHSLDLLTKRSMLAFAEQKNLKSERYNLLVTYFASQNWALPFKDSDMEILTDGYQFVQNMLHDIANAHHHIHIEMYIFNDDALGNIFADALIDKAKQGVEVRVIYDDVGCWNVKNSFYERMEEGGVRVYPFMPVHFPAFTSKVNYRNHRKLCVIDGKTGYIGGMNIADRYVKGTAKQAWRDTHLRITGNAVYGIQKAFLVDWYFVTGILISSKTFYPEQNGIKDSGAIMQIVTSSPVNELADIMHGYVRVLLEAKKYVYIETPYFLPTEPVMFALKNAALSGVDVRIMIPRKGDAKLVEWASRSFILEVIEAGVKVYLYNAGFNHSKLMVSDDGIATCGSTNVDFRSFENNMEANLFVYDTQHAIKMRQLFEKDLENCTIVDDDMLNIRIPFLQRLWESLVRLLAPLL
ncbi:MAG: cardiolipin synthase [Prevotella sp.]|nr:cardiolipin synthase [Prevotella sp.]